MARADISGRLEALNLVDILGLLRDKGSGGRLRVVSPKGTEYDFFLESGELVLAQAAGEPFRERALARYEADREMVLRGASLHGDWLSSLVALGFLSEEEARRRLTDHCVSIGIGVGSLEEGDFDFFSGEKCDLTEIRIDVFYLQLEITRRLDELRRSLPPELGERGKRLRLLRDPAEIKEGLALDEWRLLHSIAMKGEAPTLGGIWEEDLFPSPESYANTLSRLVEAGVVEVEDSDRRPPIEADKSESEVQEEAVDTDSFPSLAPVSERSTASVSPQLIASMQVLRPTEIQIHSEFQLVELKDGRRERRFTLRDRALLGRAEDNDICLSHENISRRHAIFSEATRAVHLQVVGKKNPALVDGQRFTSGWLRGGEIIVFYPYSFLLEGKAEVRKKG